MAESIKIVPQGAPLHPHSSARTAIRPIKHEQDATADPSAEAE